MATSTVSGTDPLAAGRAALERADWDEARTIFEKATADGGSAEAWEGLGQAAWWQGDEETTFTARERAFRLYRAAGDVRRAAWAAMWIASDYFDFRGDDAVAAAWLRRGRELLEGQEPSRELGFIALLECDLLFQAKRDPEAARDGAVEALELARRMGDADVEVVALAMLGSTMIASGAVEEGLERLAECVSLAVAEEFDEAASPGWAYCHTVAACAEVGDFGRAEQWCDVLHSWCSTWRARQFFGICRTAYGEVLAARGDWQAAEEELRSAMDDLEETRPALAGPAAVRLGHLRLRQGKDDEARALFEGALPLPQALIAIGELDLAGGDATAATEAAERVLRNLPGGGVLNRFPALELLARAHAAGGDHERARELADEVAARRRAPRHSLHACPRRTGPGRRPDGRGRPRSGTASRRGCGRPLRRVVSALRMRARTAAARGRARGARPRRPGGGRGARCARDARAAGRPAGARKTAAGPS